MFRVGDILWIAAYGNERRRFIVSQGLWSSTGGGFFYTVTSLPRETGVISSVSQDWLEEYAEKVDVLEQMYYDYMELDKCSK